MADSLTTLLDDLNFASDVPSVCGILRQRLEEKDTYWQQQKVERDREFFLVKDQLADAEKRIDDLSTLNQDFRSQLTEIESDRSEYVARLRELQTVHENCFAKQTELSRKCVLLSEEKKGLSEVIERRVAEFTTLSSDLNDAKAEIKRLIVEKCQAQMQLDELKSQELTLEFRERRWDQERQMLSSESEWYAAQLKEKEQQILTLKSGLHSTELELNRLSSQKEEELRGLRLTVQTQDEKVVNGLKQIEDLNQQLKDSVAARLNVEEAFEKELDCQKKLTDMYKDGSVEAENKVQQLTDALEKVQQLFNDAKEAHLSLQQMVDSLEAEGNEKLRQKNEEIESLHFELDKANELLQSNSRAFHLSDEEIHGLSPAAASATKLLKSGHSLTQIYRDYYLHAEEMEVLKAENVRLKKYLDDIVTDIESKSTRIKAQRDDYVRCLETVDRLRLQLSDAEKEKQQFFAQRDSIQRQFVYTKAELERVQRQNSHSAVQIRELLLAVEKARRGLYDSSVLDADDDFIVFRNIEELQEKNQQLLSALDEAKTNREEVIRSTQIAEVTKLRDQLEQCAKELSDLKTLREKQNDVIAAISSQRDSYRKMLEEAKASSHSSHQQVKPSDAQQSSGQSVELSESMAKLNKEFELHRKEKIETDKISAAKITELQQSNRELATENTKLTADVEFERQRFKTLQGNLSQREKLIEQLRERTQNYSNTIAKHETSVTHLMQEVATYREEITRNRVEKERLTEEFHRTKNAYDHLLHEAETFKRDKHRQNMLSATLQELQARVERQEAEQTIELKQRIVSLTKEKESLEETLRRITDQHNDYTKNYKETIQSLQGSLDEKERQSKLAAEQMENSQKTVAELRTRVAALENQLAVVSGTGRELAVERFQKEAQQMQNKLSYAELQLSDVTHKNTELSSQLHRLENEKDQYKKLADTFEQTLKENQEAKGIEMETAMTQLTELTERLQQIEVDFGAKSERCHNLEDEVRELQQRRTAELNEKSQQLADLQTKLTKSADSHAQLQQQLTELRQSHDALEAEKRTVESNLLAEMSLRDELNKSMESLQSSFEQLQSELSDLRSQNASLLGERDQMKELREHSESVLQAKCSELEQRVSQLQQENDARLEDIQKLSYQLVANEKLSQGSPKTSAEATPELAAEAVDADLSGASVESLVEVVRHLRRERQIAMEKMQLAEEDARRVRHRLEVVERQQADCEQKLRAAEDELAVAAENEKERTQLYEQLAVLDAFKEHNARLQEEKEQQEAVVHDLNRRFEALESKFVSQQSEQHLLSLALNETETAKAAAVSDSELWQRRYQEVLAQRADIDPEHLQKLRSDLDESQKKEQESQLRLKEIILELNQCRKKAEQAASNLEALSVTKQALESQVKDLSELGETSKTKIAELTAELEDVNNKSEEKTKILEQARRVGRKYKTLYDELLPKFESVQQTQPDQASTVASQASVPQAVNAAEKERGDKLEEQLLNLQRDFDAVSQTKLALDVQLTELRSVITDLEKGLEAKQTELEQKELELSTVSASGGMAAPDESAALTKRIEELEQTRRELEAQLEEKDFRVDSLASLHGGCGRQIAKLSETVKELNLLLEKEKRDNLLNKHNLLSEIKELRGREQPGKATAIQPPLLAHTAGLGSQTVAVRTSGPATGASFRGRATASIRPITEDHHRTPTASIQPITAVTTTAPAVFAKSRAAILPSSASVSPGPSLVVPDQSSSAVVPGSAAVSTTASITSLGSTGFYSGSGNIVPQAVVSPRKPAGGESDNNGGSMISSSSTAPLISLVEPSTSEDVSRKRPSERESSSLSLKRFRATSPEQVTTSETIAGHRLFGVAANPAISSAQDLVESSQGDDILSDDDVLVLDDAGEESDVVSASGTIGEAGRSHTLQIPAIGRGFQESFAFEELSGDSLVPRTPVLARSSSGGDTSFAPSFALAPTFVDTTESGLLYASTTHSVPAFALAGMRSPDQSMQSKRDVLPSSTYAPFVADETEADSQENIYFGQQEADESSEAQATEQDIERVSDEDSSISSAAHQQRVKDDERLLIRVPSPLQTRSGDGTRISNNVIRLRRPIIWEEGAAGSSTNEGEALAPSSSSAVSSLTAASPAGIQRGVRARGLNVARRTRGFRGGVPGRGAGFRGSFGQL